MIQNDVAETMALAACFFTVTVGLMASEFSVEVPDNSTVVYLTLKKVQNLQANTTLEPYC